MRELTLKEKDMLRKKHMNDSENITVTDFKSAVQRCEQKFSQLYTEQVREMSRDAMRKRRQDTNSKQLQYDKQYLDDIIKGKRNPPCADKTRSFIKKMSNKYGSFSLYQVYKNMK